MSLGVRYNLGTDICLHTSICDEYGKRRATAVPTMQLVAALTTRATSNVASSLDVRAIRSSVTKHLEKGVSVLAIGSYQVRRK